MVTIVSLREAALVLSLGVFLVFVAKGIRKALSLYLTPIRHLRGPPSERFLQGNRIPLRDDSARVYQRWIEEYGPTFVLRGPLETPVLFTTDMRTINHILTHSMIYHKSDRAHEVLSRTLGKGVLVAEGEKHRQQRRVMNPAFGPAQIRELTEIFLEKANELCEFWNKQVSEQGGSSARTNVMDGLSKMTLDVIGLAGFNYRFDAMDTTRPPNALTQAFKRSAQHPLVTSYWINLFPILGKIRNYKRFKSVKHANMVMQQIGKQIVDDKKAAIMRENSEKGSNAVEKSKMQGRDLLTLLMKANMAMDIPESQRMTDEEVLAQIPTFLVAGHETTSTATTWCLFALTSRPDIQTKLREELLSVDTDMPSMEELQALPYLDQVVRETLRLHAPVPVVVRVPMSDDVLPVSEPLVDRHGKVLHELRVAKNTTLIVPILALHTSRAIWGDDAFDFRPERWESPPESTASMPGVWGHLMTFLGGPHACIGYRFSLVEMKALVFTLIRRFEFELAVPKEEIITRGMGAIKRPGVRSEAAKGSQLPLVLRPYKGA